MQKIALILLLLGLGLQVSFAQLENLRFGFQVSPTFSWMTSDDNRINSNGTNLGVKIGTMGEWYFSEHYILTSGIGISFNHGGTLQHDIGGDIWSEADLSDPVYDSLPDMVNLKYSLQFFEIPFGFRMRTKEFGHFRYFFEAPIFRISIRTQARGTIEGPEIARTEKENIRQQVSALNISYGFGAGVEYSLTGSTSLIGGIYYENNFSDITNDEGRLRNGKREDSKGTYGLVNFRLGILF